MGVLFAFACMELARWLKPRPARPQERDRGRQGRKARKDKTMAAIEGAAAREAQGAGMGRIVLASLVGTTIEFYDFYIFGTAAALVFGPMFFP